MYVYAALPTANLCMPLPERCDFLTCRLTPHMLMYRYTSKALYMSTYFAFTLLFLKCLIGKVLVC